ncbi:MAG: ABC transporter ATP-binding protein [bacterium]|nr:ABC transporter ATP-binding protein [bacterium]
MHTVTVQNIVKRFENGAVSALDDVSFDVRAGELFGLIGPDGAGKTSLFRILTTVLLADSGSASVAGYDVVKDYKKIRGIVGYMPGRFSLYQDLSVQENLEFFATLFGTSVKENYDLIRDIYVQLEPFKTRRAGKLSGGMKQKLALCCALIHRPKVMFLDEPTTGVDPVSRKEFWEMLARLKQQGITILVSTPYMDEARRCERIALMQSGRILSIATPQEITQTYPSPLFAVSTSNMPALRKDLKSYENIKSAMAFGETMHVTFVDNELRSHNAVNKTTIDYDTIGSEADQFKHYLVQQGHGDVFVERIEPTIEDCFIQLMQQPAMQQPAMQQPAMQQPAMQQ